MRYQTAADMRTGLLRLQRLVSGISQAGASPQAGAYVTAGRRKRWFVWAAVAGAAICGVAGWLLARVAADHGAAQPYMYRQITDTPGIDQFPSLDATGEWVAYSARPRGNWDICLQRVDGRNERNLTEAGDADDTQPMFSPDGKSIVFRSSRDGGGLFVMGATGEAPERISTTGFNPCRSPDGRKAAFATEGVDSPDDRYLAVSALWTADAATREKRMIFAGDAVQPAWPPGGARIAFRRAKDGHRDIATIPAGGGEPAPVTPDRSMDWNPAWSADGRHLYFLSDRSGSMNLWRAAIDEQTGEVKGELEAVSLPTPHAGHVAFSRDGRRFLFSSNTFRSTLNRVAFDPQRGETAGAPAEIPLSFSQPIRPHLSLDGERLAFNSRGLIEDIHIGCSPFRRTMILAVTC
jgi:dipeptidyl aminopeptidase/acylaminoacyl peptidase